MPSATIISNNRRSHQLYSAVLVSQGRTSFPLIRTLYYHLFLDMSIAIFAVRILTVSKTANHTVVILPQTPQSALFYFPPETNLCNQSHQKRQVRLQSLNKKYIHPKDNKRIKTSPSDSHSRIPAHVLKLSLISRLKMD